MLPEGEYRVAIGLFKRADTSMTRVYEAQADFQIHSRGEARYYFGQFTDLKRRVRKLERAVGRLFR